MRTQKSASESILIQAAFRRCEVFGFSRDGVYTENIIISWESVTGFLIPSFQTTANWPLNDLHCDTVSAKRVMSGVNLCSGIFG